MTEKAVALIPLADIRQMAEVAAKSGLFPAIRSPEAAMALMMICNSEGLHPMQALRRYHIVDGKPSMRADAMLAEFQERGGKVEWIERSDERAEAVFAAPGAKPEKVSWSIQQARNAGLASKDVWRKYPRQMLSARVTSEGVRLVMPSIVVGIYTPEEVQDFDDTPRAPTPAKPYPPEDGKNAIVEKAQEAFKGAKVIDVVPDAPKALTPAEAAGITSSESTPGPVESTDLVECWRRVTTGSKKAHTEQVEWIRMDPQPRRSLAQNAALHALKAKRGIGDDDWRARLLAKFNKESSRDLADYEASRVIEALEDTVKRFGTIEQKDARKLERAKAAQSDVAEAAGVNSRQLRVLGLWETPPPDGYGGKADAITPWLQERFSAATVYNMTDEQLSDAETLLIARMSSEEDYAKAVGRLATESRCNPMGKGAA